MKNAMITAATVLATAALLGCSAEPRSASYFEEHPQETVKVVANCKDGSHRGEECNNAEFAAAKARRREAMERYRAGFQ